MRYYSQSAIDNYISTLGFNCDVYEIGEEYPDYIIVHRDTLSNIATQIEFITTHFCGLAIGYAHDRYFKKVPKKHKEYLLEIGRRKELSQEDWIKVIHDVRDCEEYWKH